MLETTPFIKFPTYRPFQVDVIRDVLASDKKVTLVEAPPGTGKSIIGMSLALTGEGQAIYLCTTKPLQDQLCVTPDTPILTANLTWHEAGSIVTGTSLLAFDEHRTPNRRMWKPAIVENTIELQKPCYRLELEDGSVLTCSDNHLWLVGQGGDAAGARWLSTEKLRVDGSPFSSKILKLLDPWQQQDDYDTGYLAAAFDGEGCLIQGDPARGYGANVNLNYYQAYNPMLDEVEQCLNRKGFPYKIQRHVHTNPKHKDGVRLYIYGRHNAIRFLGQIRPVRLLSRMKLERFGMINPARPIRVIRKDFIGMRTVICLQTSSHTFVADGFASHNSSDFSNFPMLKGRSNYPCFKTPDTEAQFPEITCEDCPVEHQAAKERENSCSGKCSYKQMKKVCRAAKVCILNTAYYLTEANYIGAFNDRDLIVVDECDVLESSLLGFVEVKVSEYILNQLGLEGPKLITKWESWKEWAEPFCRKLSEKIDILKNSMNDYNPSVKAVRKMKQLKGLYSKGILLQNLLDDSWIYQVDAGKFGVIHSFKPTWISKLAEKFFWNTAHRFVLMSGTIGGPAGACEMARTLGLQNGQWDYIEVPNQFPAERRPIYYRPTANLTRKTVEQERPLLLPEIQKIMDEFPQEKGLIHTVSYSLATYVMDQIRSDRLKTHGNGAERQEALSNFKNSPDPLVLISPSMDRGIDLPYDACRFVVICKVPFADLSSKQTSRRLYSKPYGQAWYNWVTACSLVQMSLRGMRASDDQCTIFILDKNFEIFYMNHKDMLPEWWRTAVHFPESKLEWLV